MTFTKINLTQIQGVTQTPDGKINIEKNINFTEQVSIPLIPPSEDSDNVIWVEPSEGNFKNRINLVNYAPSFKSDFKNIFFSSPDTLSLGGNTGILNDLVISGDNTILNVRSSSIGTVQWSILEIKGDLTIASGCTLNLIRTPLIVRGNILGNGIITSPDGANGGTGGVGGPGGAGGSGAIVSSNSPFSYISAMVPGSNAVTTWSNQNGLPGSSMSVEYGVSAGSGGNGGRGGGGGGGGGGSYVTNNPPSYSRSAGNGARGASNGPANGPAGGAVFTDLTFPISGGGGGGTGGVGTPGNSSAGGTGGPGSTATSGTSGTSAATLSINYIGIGNPSPVTSESVGAFGGAGGPGSVSPLGTGNSGSPGSPGGTGGNGGAGGGTGGAHLSIYCAGTVSSPITIRPGKGGLTGGSTSLPRAQTGSLWLFTLNNNPINTDITGATGTPNGPAGILTRTLISNTSGITDFFTNILFEPNGLTPEKTKFAVTNS